MVVLGESNQQEEQRSNWKEIKEEKLGSSQEGGGRCRQKFKEVIKDTHKSRGRLLNGATQCFPTDSSRIE